MLCSLLLSPKIFEAKLDFKTVPLESLMASEVYNLAVFRMYLNESISSRCLNSVYRPEKYRFTDTDFIVVLGLFRCIFLISGFGPIIFILPVSLWSYVSL